MGPHLKNAIVGRFMRYPPCARKRLPQQRAAMICRPRQKTGVFGNVYVLEDAFSCENIVDFKWAPLWLDNVEPQSVHFDDYTINQSLGDVLMQPYFPV